MTGMVKTGAALTARVAAFAIAAAVAMSGASASGEISTNVSATKGPLFKSSFRAPPSDAVKSLKAAVGKPFDAGWVFVDGKFVPPPYKVERWGNVIRINQIQVTKEVVPWSEFVKTQEGAKMTKTESADPAADAPLVEDEPEEEPEEEIEEDIDDDESSLDDLFDDAPAAPKKPSASKKPPKKRRPPKPRKPAVKVSYSYDGPFVPNAKTQAYVKKINDYRTRIDMDLRSGGYYFFGSNYQPFSGDAGAVKHIIEKLPDIMRKSTELDRFAASLRAAGISFMPRSLVSDLFKGRICYPQIQQRLKKQSDPLRLQY